MTSDDGIEILNWQAEVELLRLENNSLRARADKAEALLREADGYCRLLRAPQQRQHPDVTSVCAHIQSIIRRTTEGESDGG